MSLSDLTNTIKNKVASAADAVSKSKSNVINNALTKTASAIKSAANSVANSNLANTAKTKVSDMIQSFKNSKTATATAKTANSGTDTTDPKLAELTENQRKLEEAFKKSQDSKMSAEAETARLNAVSQEAYKQKQLENEQAQNQFAQNQSANQLTALDAIRRSNASAIANGANAGLSAANQLSSILGLQQDTSQEATDIANSAIDSAAQLNTQLNENAVTGAQTANEFNAALGANEAELAKAMASNSAAIADIRAAELAAKSQKEAAEIAAEAQKEAAKINTGTKENTTTTVNPDGTTTTVTTTTNAEEEKLKQQQEADRRAALLQQRDTITSGLTNLTANFRGGDKHTYVTSYYDPFDNEIKDVSGEGMQERQVNDIINKLNTEVKKAYDSGDEAAIKKWTKRAEMFSENLKYRDDACLIPGTKITLADGSYKNVEDITDKDTLLVWDIVEGGWKKAPVLFVEHDQEEERDVIELEFDNNISLGIIDDHGLFNTTLMKYVYIKTLEDAMQYIGHEFFYRAPEDSIKKLKLNNATVSRKKITAHSPCTVKHLCVIANDILTMPGNTEPFTNVCDVDPYTLRYDNKQLFNYIETFGLFSEKDFEGILPPSIFFAFQGPLLKIKIAKGETSMEEINKLIERYSEHLR